MADGWTKWFADFKEVTVVHGDILKIEGSEALVSPANSFGIMNGGIDLAYSLYLGWQVSKKLQEKINKEWNGELPVGCATSVITGSGQFPYLISAPTMRVPQDVSKSINAYLAFRAALFEAERLGVSSVACPGLAISTGNLNHDLAARQMMTAYKKFKGEKFKDNHLFFGTLEEDFMRGNDKNGIF
jgi:O-acetyl-ADP-ribose deacetylase (regulator of RNase III)